MNKCLLVVLALLFSSLIGLVSTSPIEAIYAAATGLEMGAPLDVRVDSFRSKRGITPYNYYSLPLCKPDKDRMKAERAKENLGAILLGSRDQPSSFEFRLGKDVSCQQLCNAHFGARDVKLAKKLASGRYFGQLSLNGFPVTSSGLSLRTNKQRTYMGYLFGHHLGELKSTQINNFLHFVVDFVPVGSNTNGESLYTITDFTVTPSSTTTCTADESSPSQGGKPLMVPEKLSSSTDTVRVPFYYSVTWRQVEEGEYRTRFDKMKEVRSRQKHNLWIAATNAIVLVFIIGAAVAMVIVRTVRRDLLAYTESEIQEELREESGWKLIRGDVFRSPDYPVAFTAVISVGCQAIFLSVVTFVSCGVGILHPTHRGSVLTGILFFFFASSMLVGYIAGRMLKFFKQQSWSNGIIAVTAIPLIMAAGYMAINFIHWMNHSTLAIPFTVCLTLLFGWLISLPPSLVGLSLGFRVDAMSTPSPIATVPRLIPVRPAVTAWAPFFIGGFVIFTASFIEVGYMLGVMWDGTPVYVLGYLGAVSAIVVVICAEVGIVVTYMALNAEDYRWWWRSFGGLATVGVYLYVYSLYYLWMYLEVRLFASVFLYMAYMLGITAIASLWTGTIGFLSSALFVRFIYNATKAE